MAREEWYADGYHLTDGIVRDIETRTGHKQRVALRGDSVYGSQQQGELWRKRYLDAGEVVVNMWIYDASQALVEQWWDQLQQALFPIQRLVHFTRALPDGIHTRECYAYCQEAVQPEWSGPLLQRVGIALHIPSGRWQDIADTTQQTVAGAALTQTLNLTAFAGATAVMDTLTYTIKGPIANPTVQSISEIDGSVYESFTYNGTLATGQSLIVNAATWAVTGAGGFTPDPSQITYTSNKFLNVYPGVPGGSVGPVVKLLGANGGAATQLVVVGRAQYQS